MDLTRTLGGFAEVVNISNGLAAAVNGLPANDDSRNYATTEFVQAFISQLNQTISDAIANGIPTGTVTPYAGTTAPENWMFCDGSELDRTTHSTLFSVIGTAYGAGNGSTTFNLPDLRGRVPAGKDDMGGTAANRLTSAGAGINGSLLGAAGGNQTHVLTADQMPSHSHTGSTSTVGDHGHTGTATSAGSHTHNTKVRSDLSVTGSGADALNQPSGTGNVTSIGMDAAGDHTHPLAINGAGSHAHTLTINATGNGQAHLNVQPTLVLNHIIKVI